MAELFKATAFMSLSSVTISEIMAWRLGILIAIIEPLITPIISNAPNQIVPLASIIAKIKVKMALASWLTIIRYFLGTLSAKAPPISDTKVMGAANETITSTRARGESSCRRSTSHPLVIICMFIPMNEANEPIKIQRKSRICNVSKMGDPRMDSKDRAARDRPAGCVATAGDPITFSANAGPFRFLLSQAPVTADAAE